MVDTRSDPSQSIPGEATSQPGVCPPDCDLPENSQENLDARLDHAIEETFPTSDPISVTVTKQAAAEVPRETASASIKSPDRARHDQAEQETAEELLDQVKETLQDVAEATSTRARDAYRAGQEYVRQVRDRYPEAAHSYREGRRTISQRATENPLMSLFLAAAVGYALAWMIRGQRRERDDHIPEYGRTGRGYAPQWDEQRR